MVSYDNDIFPTGIVEEVVYEYVSFMKGFIFILIHFPTNFFVVPYRPHFFTAGSLLPR